MTTKARNSAPTLAAPAKTESPVGQSAPRPIEELSAQQLQESIVDMGPTLLPPGVAGALEAQEAVTGTWTSNVYVTAMWSIDEQRNAYMHVQGIGWRKLFNGRDGAFTALVFLASQARQTNRPISFRQESDGMVYEIYLW